MTPESTPILLLGKLKPREGRWLTPKSGWGQGLDYEAGYIPVVVSWNDLVTPTGQLPTNHPSSTYIQTTPDLLALPLPSTPATQSPLIRILGPPCLVTLPPYSPVLFSNPSQETTCALSKPISHVKPSAFFLFPPPTI